MEQRYKELLDTLDDLHDDLPENVQPTIKAAHKAKNTEDYCRRLEDVGTQLGAHRREGAVAQACDGVDLFVMDYCRGVTV